MKRLAFLLGYWLEFRLSCSFCRNSGMVQLDGFKAFCVCNYGMQRLSNWLGSDEWLELFRAKPKLPQALWELDGGLYCQNCSRVLVAKQGEICADCLARLAARRLAEEEK